MGEQDRLQPPGSRIRSCKFTEHPCVRHLTGMRHAVPTLFGSNPMGKKEVRHEGKAQGPVLQEKGWRADWLPRLLLQRVMRWERSWSRLPSVLGGPCCILAALLIKLVTFDKFSFLQSWLYACTRHVPYIMKWVGRLELSAFLRRGHGVRESSRVQGASDAGGNRTGSPGLLALTQGVCTPHWYSSLPPAQPTGGVRAACIPASLMQIPGGKDRLRYVLFPTACPRLGSPPLLLGREAESTALSWVTE